MSEQKKEIIADQFKVYLNLKLEQQKSIAATIEASGVYQGKDEEVRQFFQSAQQLGEDSPKEKELLYLQIREDIAHR
jgi:hypothetical protein